MTRWLDVAVVPDFSWPNVPVELPFHDTKIVLIPSTDDLLCTASAHDPNGKIEYEKGAENVRRFLSCFAWTNRGGVRELSTCGTNHPEWPSRQGTATRERSFHAQQDPPEHIYLPLVTDGKAQRALAVHREGLSINSETFSFLSHFKILNILFAGGKEQKDWINQHLRFVGGYAASERLRELRKHSDIGAYLYHQGRCAVAHAFDNDVVDPDSYIDTERLYADLQLMRELAEICIEKEFGVLRPATFWTRQRILQNQSPQLLQISEKVNGRYIYVPTGCA